MDLPGLSALPRGPDVTLPSFVLERVRAQIPGLPGSFASPSRTCASVPSRLDTPKVLRFLLALSSPRFFQVGATRPALTPFREPLAFLYPSFGPRSSRCEQSKCIGDVIRFLNAGWARTVFVLAPVCRSPRVLARHFARLVPSAPPALPRSVYRPRWRAVCKSPGI